MLVGFRHDVEIGRRMLCRVLEDGSFGVDPVHTYQQADMMQPTVGESIHCWKLNHPSLEAGIQTPREIVEKVIRIVISCCLMRGGDLIEPDVLNDLREKWERTRDPKYVEKSHRRGKVGWHVGRQAGNTSPHWRGPHPCLFHVGPGRRETIIKTRAGSVVNRKRITDMPTGFGGADAV